jgi:hypothetical protein
MNLLNPERGGAALRCDLLGAMGPAVGAVVYVVVEETESLVS